jgi:hypothetical protein
MELGEICFGRLPIAQRKINAELHCLPCGGVAIHYRLLGSEGGARQSETGSHTEECERAHPTQAAFDPEIT